MGYTRNLVGSLAVTGIGVGATVAARSAAEHRAARRFYGLPLEVTEPGSLGAGHGGCPIVFHQADGFQAWHTASLDAVQNAVTGTGLHPVRLPGGRAIVFVGAMRYGDITANGVAGPAAVPYGEVMVAIPVTRRHAPPFLPLLAPRATGVQAGAFVLHLPVTSRVARDVGRKLWGLPKFVADMDFDDSTIERRVHLAEGGRTILTVRVGPSGRPSIATDRFVLYSVLDHNLIETILPTYGLRQLRWGKRGGHLELGDHLVADELRQLDVSPEPFLTSVVTGQRLAMTVGRRVGPVASYAGYLGEDRDLGRYVVRYPDAGSIDRYAPTVLAPGGKTALVDIAQEARLEARAVAA
jgi:hypothetical protein